MGACVLGAIVVGVSGAGSASAQTDTTWQAAPTAVVRAVTTVPASVFDAVALQPSVTPPVVLQGQPALEYGGKPGVLYISAEPCPLCAAERWAFLAATSRFGKWSRLGTAASASDDVDPNTQSFTFARASYSSPYLAIKTREILGSKKQPDGNYAPLQAMTAQQKALVERYDTARYFPNNAGSLPFLDFGNQSVVAGPSYDPAILAGLTREQIATDLGDPTKATTKAIIGTANYLTAAICAIDGQRPAKVCKSPGATKAAKLAKIGARTENACTPVPKQRPVCAATGSSGKH